jgi:hypothetical protein
MALLNTWASQQDQATLSPLDRLLNNYIQKGDAPLAYLMRGDAQGLLKDLNTPKPVNTTQDMTDLALNLVGSINPIGNVTKGLLGTTVYHGTSPEAAKAIQKKGFDLSKSADGSIWFTTDPRIGEVAATGKGGIIKTLIDENKIKLGSYNEADKYFTDELISQGYQGLKFPNAAGEFTHYTIFDPETLKGLLSK